MNWDQLQTILWLRWRLMRNQWSRSGGLGAAISIVAVFVASVMAAGCFVGGLIGGWSQKDATPQVIMVVWLVVTLLFLFVWMAGLLAELQRSETIDLQKLMHLPAVLGQLFMVNYLVSHFTLSIVLAVPMMAGLTLGLALTRGPHMLLLLPLALSMVAMVSAWTYCLRGWLATMMHNPRRRRTVIMCISLTFILLSQAPNLYFNVLGHRPGARHAAADGNNWQRQQADRAAATQGMFDRLAEAQGFIPPLWVSLGARDLVGHRLLTALYGTLGCLGLAALGLLRAYRNTIVAFQGGTGGKSASRPRPAPVLQAGAAAAPRLAFLEWRLPVVPEPSAALALATLRFIQRAPEIKMALASSFISMLVLGAMFLFRAPPSLPDVAKPFIATGVAVFSTFLLIHFFANQFGFDRDGFRSLILAPVERRWILLGKNLAMVSVGFLLALIPVVFLAVWLRLPPLTAAATLFQLVTLQLIACVAGNLLSITVPYRIQPGSLKPTKMPALAMLTMVFCQMLMPMVLLPVFSAPLLDLLWRHLHLPDFVPVNLLLSAVMCGLAVTLYAVTLGPLGRLLHRRETRILGIVTVEVE